MVRIHSVTVLSYIDELTVLSHWNFVCFHMKSYLVQLYGQLHLVQQPVISFKHKAYDRYVAFNVSAVYITTYMLILQTWKLPAISQIVLIWLWVSKESRWPSSSTKLFTAGPSIHPVQPSINHCTQFLLIPSIWNKFRKHTQDNIWFCIPL